MAGEDGGSGIPAELLSLPWKVQLSLASGYAAYLLSYSGIRGHHKAIDTTFSTLVFGLVAIGTYSLVPDKAGPIWASAAGFLASCVVGLFWRAVGRPALTWLLRKRDFSWSDDDPSAWASILADSKHRVSQIAVLTTDGEWLECRDTAPFADAPFGPCKLGPSGDVALYLTHTTDAQGVEKEMTTVVDADIGSRLTYVPADKVRTLNLRHETINRSWREEVVSAARWFLLLQ